MKRTALIALAAAALSIAACGSSGAGSSPEDTFKAMKSAFAERDFGKLYDLLAGAELDRAKRQLDTDRSLYEDQRIELCRELEITPGELDTIPVRAYFVKLTVARSRARPETLKRLAEANFRSAEVEGETCVVKYEAGNAEERMEMVRRDGRWYISRY